MVLTRRPISVNAVKASVTATLMRGILDLMEPTTVGSLWLENDLHENELEFESHMGRSKKNVRVTSDGIHAEIHEIWTCVAPAAPPLFHAAVNPCLQGESPWNWSCNSVNLRKSTVTWMRRHYVFTLISRWSTFSSTVNFCNINCVIFSDTHCSFGPPILWHRPFHAGVSNHEDGVSKFAIINVFICAYLSITCLNWCINHPRKRLLKSYSAQCILRSLLRAVCQTPHVYIAETWRRPQPVAGFTKGFRCCSNLKENVSNNFKYSYLIYWAFMFLPQMGCYGLCRNLRRDLKFITYAFPI